MLCMRTETIFVFTCINPEDPQDPSVGLVNGQLAIPGYVLRREVFDPVVNEVCWVLVLHMSRLILTINDGCPTYQRANCSCTPTHSRTPSRRRFCGKRIPQATGAWSVRLAQLLNCKSPWRRYCDTPRGCRVWAFQPTSRVDHYSPKIILHESRIVGWAGRLVEEAGVYHK